MIDNCPYEMLLLQNFLENCDSFSIDYKTRNLVWKFKDGVKRISNHVKESKEVAIFLNKSKQQDNAKPTCTDVDKLMSHSGETKQKEILMHHAQHPQGIEITEGPKKYKVQCAMKSHDNVHVLYYCSGDSCDVTNSWKGTLNYGNQLISSLVNNLTSQAETLTHETKHEEAEEYCVMARDLLEMSQMDIDGSQNLIRFMVRWYG